MRARERGPLEVSALVLFQLDGLEEGLEVSGAESGVIVPLDDLDEHGGAILERLGEDLERVRQWMTQFWKTGI